MASFSEANAKFIFDFFHLLCKDHPHENIIFSPVNLSAALGLLYYGSRGDTEAEIKKVLHLDKVKEDIRSETRSHTEAAADNLGRRHKTSLPTFSCVQTTSGEDETLADRLLVASLAETVPHPDTEGSASSYFIPWRKHLVGMEDDGNLIHEESSPEEKRSPNPASSHKNWEEQSINENMASAHEHLPTSFSNVTTENLTTLLREFRRTVSHADNNVEAFKETLVHFKECCDNMCRSMSDLQGVLETLITILRE